ncbi:hypothetical protein ACMFFK_20270 [Serratia marcescens]|uniref:hypothetical protein n=3 Tax=Serratia TaxID=613 RepID=UPI0010571463|nr:hypothetical protein [Serratia marcescens]MBH2971935.1 hypothetical protein [Serratia marcescens]MBH2980048.1 hypothetical protein [Serratia marcescens]MBN3985529.1 hypothetical protein [Serratia marcescens]MBN5326667.1 hypothetical protein [Serratia marcescens]MBN5350303.1 hypothetical protein [Serratia marcescens]
MSGYYLSGMTLRVFLIKHYIKDLLLMLVSDPRYHLLAVCSAQHLRAVAERICARDKLEPLAFDAVLWRSCWTSPLPTISPESSSEFLQSVGHVYPRATYELRSWLISGRRKLDLQAADKLIYLARVIEKEWKVEEQPSVWRKHPSNRLNGYAYNIVQILIHTSVSEDYPKENNISHRHDLLTHSPSNSRLTAWMEKYQHSSKDPFVFARLDVTRISNMRELFLWQISLETRSGLYTSATFEAAVGTRIRSYDRPVPGRRIQAFIGYI